MELKTISKAEYDKYFALLEDDFCLEERKTKLDELAAFEDKNFSPNFIYEDGKLIGYACYWEFEDFLFVEHFAILKDMRGTGCGSRFLKEFTDKVNKPIILEVELPESEEAIKRIKFYERLGFVINPYTYAQPSYHEGKEPVPMHVMTYKTVLEKEAYDKHVLEIKHVVYNQ